MTTENLKIPIEAKNYAECSELVRRQIGQIIKDSIENDENKIFIRTNLKRGLPLENINKVAGPFVEAWAVEKFEMIAEDPQNKFELVHVEAGARLNLYDILLQFKKNDNSDCNIVTTGVDVKATSEDIAGSGKSPNITSYARIRTEYVKDPDYIFVILSLKHKVYGEKEAETGMTNGIMEVVSYSVYDLKYVSENDLCYNPALGTGQLQIKDIHYVTEVKRTVWEFCQMLDKKYIRSKGEEPWLKLANTFGWLKGKELIEPEEIIERSM